VHRELEDRFAGAEDVVFFNLQTVWEGRQTNTPENGPKVAARYGKVPTAFDAHVDGARLSLVMTQYGTGGTPWTIVIDRKGVVQFNQVTPKTPDVLERLIRKLR